MARPIIGKISPQNAESNFTINFTYAGNLSQKNRMIIRNADDLSDIKYDHIEESMNLSNTYIYDPTNPDRLINGHQYTVEIICYDSNNVPSETSQRQFFWCLTPPTLSFDIASGTTIQNSSLNVSLTYIQPEEDDLSQIQYYLLDSYHGEIYHSDVVYNPDIEDLSYTFKGLENTSLLHSYYLKAIGQTYKQMSVSTEVQIFVQYDEPTTYARLLLSSENGDGIVDYQTNVSIIRGTREDYEYENGFINLEDDVLTYNEHFIVPGDFSMCIKHIFNVGTLMKCANQNKEFVLSIVDCTEGQYRYKLVVPNGVCDYILYSKPFYGNRDITMVCWIRRINNVYELSLYDEENNIEDYNLFVGETRPSYSIATDYDVWINPDGATVRIAKEDVVVWYQTEEPEDAEEYNIFISDIDMEEEEDTE